MGLFNSRKKASGTEFGVRPWGRAYGPPDAFLSAEYQKLYSVDVNFNNQWRLSAMRLSENNGFMTLALRWRCLRCVFWPTFCFAHVLDAGGRQISSMDHDLLDGRVPPSAWKPGDEACEFRSLHLESNQVPHLGSSSSNSGDGDQPSSYTVRLGLYNPETNLRLPLVFSTFPLVDDYTAVVVQANVIPGEECAFRLQPREVSRCRVVFGEGVELAAYSTTRSDALLWLRLRWRVSRIPSEPVLFFGHAVTAQDPNIAARVWFDQEMAVHSRGPWPRFDLDIVRAVPADTSQPLFLRAGVCTSRKLVRLPVKESSFACDRQNQCIFIPIEI